MWCQCVMDEAPLKSLIGHAAWRCPVGSTRTLWPAAAKGSLSTFQVPTTNHPFLIFSIYIHWSLAKGFFVFTISTECQRKLWHRPPGSMRTPSTLKIRPFLSYEVSTIHLLYFRYTLSEGSTHLFLLTFIEGWRTGQEFQINTIRQIWHLEIICQAFQVYQNYWRRIRWSFGRIWLLNYLLTCNSP